MTSISATTATSVWLPSCWKCRGNIQAAALLLDSTDLGYTTLGHVDIGGYRERRVRATIECPAELIPQFNETIREQIHWCLREQGGCFHGLWVEEVELVPTDAYEDWRSSLARRLGLSPSTNQARLAPTKPTTPRRDRLYFRDPSEIAVYDALMRAESALPTDDSILVAPNAGVRVRGKTWEVDFLVTYKSRVGVIEVDGATHYGRRVADKSREKILEDGGIAYVDRIAVEDSTSAHDLDVLITRFLARLARA